MTEFLTRLAIVVVITLVWDLIAHNPINIVDTILYSAIGVIIVRIIEKLFED